MGRKRAATLVPSAPPRSGTRQCGRQIGQGHSNTGPAGRGSPCWDPTGGMGCGQ